MNVLAVNAGSSSLRLSVLDDRDNTIHRTNLPAIQGALDAKTAEEAIAPVRDCIDAVGHRIVHGGNSFTSAVLIDEDVETQLRQLTELAPLHQPRSLAGIDALRTLLPEAPAVACFDTAFHKTLPEAASTYAIPAEWRRMGIKRYGFHGLSHSYASQRAAKFMSHTGEQLRVVTCHLGAGASLAAVRNGRSVDTTMGFTPLEGLVMATRSGTVDPGMLAWLLPRAGGDVANITETLERSSGLLGLTGTSDMAAVLRSASDGNPDAGLAVEIYLHRLRSGIAAMCASLGGLDVLVFTGGVGENAASIREDAAEGLGFLGIAIDKGANSQAAPDADVTHPGAPVRTLVVRAREDLQMAREVRSLLE